MTDPLGLGVRAVINAGGAQSRLGGSTLDPAVVAAMDAAASAYVEVELLHDEVGRRLAELTGNEAAAVAAGSAAGLMVAVSAAIAGSDPDAAARLPQSDAEPPAVAVWNAHLRGPLAGADAVHDNGYLNSIHLGGGRVRAMATPHGVRADDAAVVWFPGMFGIPDEDGLLAALIAAARPLGVPVIVDAADQIPPIARTRDYTRDLGAAVAIFSGGKGLGGPTSTGLVVGETSAIAAFRANSGTEHSTGRVAKVGREELVGLLEAVRRAVALDETARYREWSAVVDDWRRELAGAGLDGLELLPLGHCGQAVPRLAVRMLSGCRECRDTVIRALWEREPRIAVLPETDARLALSPQLVRADERAVVATAVREEVAAHRCVACAG